MNRVKFLYAKSENKKSKIVWEVRPIKIWFDNHRLEWILEARDGIHARNVDFDMKRISEWENINE